MSFFNPIPESNGKTDEVIGKALQKLITLISNVTEFSPKELKAISLLQHDEILRELFIDFYLKNKKHLKRKHSVEILKALKYIASVLNKREEHRYQFGGGDKNWGR